MDMNSFQDMAVEAMPVLVQNEADEVYHAIFELLAHAGNLAEQGREIARRDSSVDPRNKHLVKQELADILRCVAQLAFTRGIKMEDIVTQAVASM